MKNKTRVRLTILTSAFLLFWGLFLLRDHIPALTKPKAVKPLSTVKLENVTALTIQSATTTNNLQKKNNQWIMIKDKMEFKADSTRVQQALDMLMAIEKGEIVSTNKNKHQDLGIGPKKIVIKAGDSTQTIYVGNPRSSSQSLVRLNEENEVFVTNNLDTIYQPEDYRNLELGLVNDQTKVTELTVSHDGIEINLVKAKDNWTVNGEVAKTETADFYVTDLKSLRATDATTDSAIRDSLTEPTVTLSVKEGTSERLATFYYKDEEAMYATTSFSQLVYIMPISTIDSLKVDQNYFTTSEESSIPEFEMN